MCRMSEYGGPPNSMTPYDWLVPAGIGSFIGWHRNQSRPLIGWFQHELARLLVGTEIKAGL